MIVHIVNPFNAPKDRDIYWQQPITFKTMKVAKKFAKGISIKHVAVVYPEDENMVPDFFDECFFLKRSTIGKFRIERKLPYLKDIIEKAYSLDAKYIIYTNVDIGLTENFYNFVWEKIKNGTDGMSITRMNVQTETILKGADHPGHDCFVFKNGMEILWGDVCIGVPFVCQPVIFSMMKFSKNFEIIRGSGTTFHVGNDMIWKNRKYSDYRKYNVDEVKKIMWHFSDFDNPYINKIRERLKNEG